MSDFETSSGIEFPHKGLWFYDRHAEDDVAAYRVVSTVAHIKTKVQEVTIQDLARLGRCLIIDGKIQSAWVDEHIYHELLVHPALIAHPHPGRILICGDGDGGALREVLRYPTVQSVVRVDTDPELAAFCRQHLPTWYQEALSDLKVRLHYGDPAAFVREADRQFDIIICDALDPIAGVRSKPLFVPQYFEAVSRILDQNGIFVTQAGRVRYAETDQAAIAIYHTVREVFPHVRMYLEYFESFAGQRAFVIGSRRPSWEELEAADIDNRLRAHGIQFRFYDGGTHRRVMSLPKPVRMGLM